MVPASPGPAKRPLGREANHRSRQELYLQMIGCREKEMDMIGKILGAVAGAKAAKYTRGVKGPGGALLGAAAAPIARRLGPLGLAAAAIGGYALRRRMNRR